jgi:hypothetical protein
MLNVIKGYGPLWLFWQDECYVVCRLAPKGTQPNHSLCDLPDQPMGGERLALWNKSYYSFRALPHLSGQYTLQKHTLTERGHC